MIWNGHLHGSNEPASPIDELLGNDLDWVTPEALCAQTDTEAFFPEKGGSAKVARKTCSLCPLRMPCLEYALTHPVYGVWGGTTGKERHLLGARRPERWVA